MKAASSTHPSTSPFSSTAMHPVAADQRPPARFCRLGWLDELLAVPPWIPEGDPSLALHARDLAAP